jgi:large subunit ribosomal protein L10
MSKRVKSMLIEDIKAKLGDHRDLLVVDVSKLDGVTANEWRLGLQKNEIKALSVKNSLARLALENVGVSGAEEILSGSSTILWGGEDIVALSKEIAKWAKEVEELEIKGATVEGECLDAAAVVKLSKSPGRLELLSIISGQNLSPGANVSGALIGIGGQLAGQIESKADGDE